MNVQLNRPKTVEHTLSGAILLYTADRRLIARRHEVLQNKSGGHRLGPGTFITSAFVDSLLESADQPILSYMPPNVVAVSRTSVAFFERAAQRTMFFKASNDVAVNAFDTKVVPQPPLLFIAGRDLRLFALSSDDRPTLSTRLYKAPYWNMIGDGNTVCTGSMHIPKTASSETTDEWVRAFFASNFTHHSGGVPRWRFGGTYAELLAAAIAKGAFDSSWLVPTNMTVQDAIAGR